jgi:hypothetical protein
MKSIRNEERKEKRPEIKEKRKECRNYDRHYPYYTKTTVLKVFTQCPLVLLLAVAIYR